LQNQLLLLSRDRDAAVPYRSGVSLHGHTRHSQESLRFIANFLGRRELLRRWFEGRKEDCLRQTGMALDLEHAHWTPPLCERLAQEVETRQIAALGLRPMVSLTDHDRIDACVLLRENPEFGDVPISTEWTVEWGLAVFHFGVHNLPPEQAHALMAAMREATGKRDETQILGLFAELSRMSGVLVVFNHPRWNFYDIPAARFDFELTRFLESANEYLHAFELNGMRNHEENRAVFRLAAEWGQPIISGGDRHGCEPNASLNLTNAADFGEFVEEIREGRQSTVLVMPQYSVPLGWRFYRNFTHVIADYPGHPEGRRRWDERTYHPDRNGEIVPMIRLWKNGTPEFLKTIFGAAMMAARVPFDGLLRRWDGRNETLQLPTAGPWMAGGTGANGRAAFGERQAEASIEDFLRGGGEPAAD
jgi:hypothetical protein